MKLINIGFGSIVSAERVIAVISPESAPVKRIISEARERGMLIDATYGRKTKSVIICDSEHIILSSVQTDIMATRFDKDFVVIQEEGTSDDR